MFCTNCGTKVNDGNKFCPNCGSKLDNQAIQAINNTNELYKIDPEESKKKIIRDNIDYYLKQFYDLKHGVHSKMNWVSFFFSLLHACYRNVWKEWLRKLWKPLVLQFVCAFLGSLFIIKQPTVAIFLFFVTFAGFIWQIVEQILFAKNFNKIYMNHVEQKLAQKDITPDPSPVRVVICWAIYTVFIIIVGVISTTLFLNFNSVNENAYDDYYSQYEYHDDTQDEVYQEETAYLEDYWERAFSINGVGTISLFDSDNVEVFAEPDYNSDIVVYIANNMPVDVSYVIYEDANPYWYYITCEGISGWVDVYSIDVTY